MAHDFPLLSEEQWQVIAALLPGARPLPQGGRPRVSDRDCLEGILWVLRTGRRWRDLPKHFPSAVTCWRRVQRWEAAGIWLPVWRAYLGTLGPTERGAWEQAFEATPPPAVKGQSEEEKGRRAFWQQMAHEFQALAAGGGG